MMLLDSIFYFKKKTKLVYYSLCFFAFEDAGKLILLLW